MPAFRSPLVDILGKRVARAGHAASVEEGILERGYAYAHPGKCRHDCGQHSQEMAGGDEK